MFGISVEKTASGFTVDVGRAEVSIYRDPLANLRLGVERLQGDGWRWWAVQLGRTFVGLSVEEPEAAAAPVLSSEVVPGAAA